MLIADSLTVLNNFDACNLYIKLLPTISTINIMCFRFLKMNLNFMVKVKQKSVLDLKINEM